MKIEWLKNEKIESSITVYENNITFRKNISNLFEEGLGIVIGIDKVEKMLVFKKITEKNKDSFEQSHLYKLDFKPSYARLNNKKIVELINSMIPQKEKKHNSCKLKALWDEQEEMLLVNVKERCEDE